MNPFERIPVLRFMVPFIMGIIAAGAVNSFQNVTILMVLVLLIVLIFYHFIHIEKDERKEYRFRWVYGVLLNIVVFTTAIVLYNNHKQLHKPEHFSKLIDNDSYTIIKIQEQPSVRKKSLKTVVSIEAVKKNNKWYKAKGKAIQYFEKDSLSLKLKYGDRMIQKTSFNLVKKPQNPYEFNYKKYLANNNIYHQSYVRNYEWRLLSKNNTGILMNIAHSAKKFILDKMQLSGIEGNEYGVVAALLLGMSDNLDADTIKNFSAAGAMHVLCVSGLHVGVFFLILSNLFGFLGKNRKSRFLQVFIIITGIWFYALITGLAPSVMRASTMFSIIAISKLFNKKTSIYNILLFSALILIIFDPFIVFKTGFWLSYLAVAGIVYLYPKFYNLLSFKSYLSEKIWSLCCVSLAAQIATSPLSVYYFNNFPNYFLISNIIVVPLATFILYTALALVCFSFIPFLSDFIASALKYLLMFLNGTVDFIESLPYSSSLIVINTSQMICIYVFLILFFAYFETLKSYYLKLSLLCFIIIAGISSYTEIKAQQRQNLTIYCLDKGLAIDIINGQETYCIANTSIINNEDVLNFHIKGNRIHNKIKNVINIPLEQIENTDTVIKEKIFIKKNYLGFLSKRIALTHKPIYTLKSSKNIETDMVIFSTIPYGYDNIISSNNPEIIVLSKNTNKFKKDEMIKRYQKDTKIFYDINENGAFILDL